MQEENPAHAVLTERPRGAKPEQCWPASVVPVPLVASNGFWVVMGS